MPQPPPEFRRLTQTEICQCFNELFGVTYNVVLQGGGAEPDYTPPVGRQAGAIVARADYATSALHEAAHWCVAGVARRRLPDYGYVYLPPPRTKAQQARFFAFELRNQAVERYLCESAGVPFRASADDPDLALAALAAFEEQVCNLAMPPPQRARRFGVALQRVRNAQS